MRVENWNWKAASRTARSIGTMKLWKGNVARGLLILGWIEYELREGSRKFDGSGICFVCHVKTRLRVINSKAILKINLYSNEREFQSWYSNILRVLLYPKSDKWRIRTIFIAVNMVSLTIVMELWEKRKKKTEISRLWLCIFLHEVNSLLVVISLL